MATTEPGPANITSADADNLLSPIGVIIISSSVGGGVLLLIIVVVILVVCLRRRRREKGDGAPTLPDPEYDLTDQPAEANSNSSRLNSENVSPNAIGTFLTTGPSSNGRSPRFVRNNDIQLATTVTSSPSNSKSKPRTKNYENVKIVSEKELPSVDNNDSSTDSESDPHDYENNPVKVALAAADAERRLQQRRNGPCSPVIHSQFTPRSPERPKAQQSRQARTLEPHCSPHFKEGPAISNTKGVGKGLWGSQDVRPSASEHTRPIKPYLNATRSLEDLDKRLVPQPPSMPSTQSFNNNKKTAATPTPPPKPHSQKTQGYVNQPAY